MPTHHYGATPGLVTPAPDQFRLVPAPLGALAAPPAGLRPPRRDDGPTVSSGGPSEGQGKADSVDCADHLQAVQLDDPDTKRKATLRARLALSGWVMQAQPNGAHIVTRWGMVRHCTSLDAVAAFAQQVGVKA